MSNAQGTVDTHEPHPTLVTLETEDGSRAHSDANCRGKRVLSNDTSRDQ